MATGRYGALKAWTIGFKVESQRPYVSRWSLIYIYIPVEEDDSCLKVARNSVVTFVPAPEDLVQYIL